MITIRIISFLGLAIVALYLPLVYFCFATALYALFFRTFEPVLIGMLIDAQFGEVHRGLWYLYTLCSVSILCSIALIRPYLRFYN